MKRIGLFFLLLVIGVLSMFAHEVNKYKYFCLNVEKNPYGIERRFNEEFLKAGFYLIGSDDYEQLDAAQKSLVLFAEYDYFINHNGNSRLSIVLKNALGATIWSNTGYGCTFLSATGDIKKCTQQIMQSFGRLKYKFDDSFTPEHHMAHPFANWTEDSVKVYLRGHRLSPIEGIYKNYSNDGNAYNIAILQYEEKYYGIIVDSDNELWKPGDTKIVLNYIEGSVYDAEYYD